MGDKKKSNWGDLSIDSLDLGGAIELRDILLARIGRLNGVIDKLYSEEVKVAEQRATTEAKIGSDDVAKRDTIKIPFVGQVRWSQLEPILPVCRNTWYEMGKQGRAPAPKRLSQRCTVWDAIEVQRWIESPTAYCAGR